MVVVRAHKPPQIRHVDLARVSPIGDHTYYDKKIRQGRPAKRWRDDLEKYWSDKNWERTAQGRITWRRHAEAFANHGTLGRSAQMMMLIEK